ncbi:MAG: S8 family serine peptidase [Acidilobaceae archaeon]
MRHLFTVFLILVIILSVSSPATGASFSTSATSRSEIVFSQPLVRAFGAFVSPVLLEESYWTHGALVEEEELLSVNLRDLLEDGVFNIINEREALGRVLILLDKNARVEVLKGKVKGLFGVYPTHIGYLAYALITKNDIDVLSRTPGILAILPDVRIDAAINAQLRALTTFNEELQVELQQTSIGSSGAYHYTVEITGAQRVWEELGIRGEEVTIAIIDTGVDYGSPALGLKAIARAETGLPLIFDSSSLGLVLTPASATPTQAGAVSIDFSNLYVFIPPYYVVNWNESKLFVGISGCASRNLFIVAPTIWTTGTIEIASAKFGLLFQVISATVGGRSSTIRYTVPVLVVDSDGDSLYDSIYVDTTTALFLLRSVLGFCGVTIPGAPASPDFSFADEVKITYGNEVIARDLNGDGLNDYSVGTLAGFVYDAAFAIILEKIGVWKELIPSRSFGEGYRTVGQLELWSGEPVALVWPGLDPYGDYVVIAYDYHSHGTFCATTAAGRDYYAQTGYGVRSIVGQAPAARVAAAPALYMGTVLTSIYFFSGFDLETPYGTGSRYLWPILSTNPWIAFDGFTWRWSYTGRPLVDITSNSYGISGWALWGWASGMDPVSLVFDYTTLTSKVAHFVAVGNGGPGWGTIASPAASSFSIGVGAATEFTYRPLYGYAWPGSSRQVVSWSNRGPTELGVVKPDVIAVGSFAWAVGRTWDALASMTLDGRRVHNLFSGTSQATPMAAGVGALVVSAYKAATGKTLPAHILKTVLMNTARDVGFNELSQGAGFVNAYDAVKAVRNPVYPKVYSTSFVEDVLKEVGTSLEVFAYTERSRTLWFEPKIFIPEIRSGGTALRYLIIEGRGTFTITPLRLVEKGSFGLCDIVKNVIEPGVITRCSGEDLMLRVTAATTSGHLVIDLEKLKGFDYFEIQLVYPYQLFERGGRTGGFSQQIGSSTIELAYWIDVGADGVFSWLETARIMYDIRGANALRIQIGDLEAQLREIEELVTKYMGVDVSKLPKHLVVRIGVSGATYRGDLPMKVRVVGYSYERWSNVQTPAKVISQTRTPVAIVVRGPEVPGFYSGYLLVEDSRQNFKALIPISFFVPIELREAASLITVSPAKETTLYKNYALRGAFDYGWRYESGDWRVFKVRVSSVLRDAWAMVTSVRWPTHGNLAFASNVDVHVYGPYTYYMVDNGTRTVTTVSVNGVQLAAELTIDPSLSAGQNPRRFWDSVEPGRSVVIAPVSRGEIYRVVLRNIQFSGLSYEEEISLEFSVLTARALVRSIGSNVFEAIITIRGIPEGLPLSITWSKEAMIRPTGSTAILYDDGSIVKTSVISFNISGSTARAVVRTLLTESAPKGVYMVPMLFRTPFPVTTVGYYLETRAEPVEHFGWKYVPYTIVFEFK